MALTKFERVWQDSLLNDSDASENLDALAARIIDGAVFIYPTETIYGVGGIVREDVERRIREVKKRPAENQLILLAGAFSDFNSFDLRFTDELARLAQVFWPGNLTMVVPSGRLGRAVGVRVSPHPLMRALSSRIRQPVFSTSANISGEPYNGDPEVLQTIFSSEIDFFIDGGILPASLPSTVIGIDSDSTIHIIREGAVPTERIFAAL